MADAGVPAAPPVGVDGSQLLRARLAGVAAAGAAVRGRAPDRSIPPAGPGPVPLTPTQAGLWFDNRVDPASPDHHRPTVLRLTGPVDPTALRSALAALVERHAALRTSYPFVAGRPAQRVHPAGPVDLAVVDLRSATVTDRSARVAELVTEAATRRFPLELEPPFSATLAILDDRDHVLVLAIHHLAIDGASADILQRELALAYEAVLADEPLRLEPQSVSFADWAAWSDDRVDDEVRQAQLSWWHRVLVAPLPAGPSRPAPGPGPAGLVDGSASPDLVPDGLRPVVVEVPSALSDALRALARAESVTLFAVLLAGLQTVAHRAWGLDDLVVGVPVTDRGHPDAEGVVGCFISVIPVRLRVAPTDTGRRLVAGAGATMIAGLDHRAVALGEIVAELLPRDEAGRSTGPITSHAQMLRLAPSVAGPSGVRIKRVPVSVPGPGINLVVADRGTSLVLEVSLGPDAGGPQDARRLADLLVDELDALVRWPDSPVDQDHPDSADADPIDSGIAAGGAASTSTSSSTLTLAGGPRGSIVPFPDGATVPELFAEIEAAHRDAVAVEDGDRSVTYGELGVRARALAAKLVAEGVRPGDAVALDLDRSLECVVAMVGTVLSGAVYVPLDPQSPPERTAEIMADAGVVVVVGPGGIERVAPPGTGPGEHRTARADDPAYVIYTSGSTGRPKGVVVPHRGIVRLVRGADFLQLRPGDTMAFTSSPAFDFTTLEVWGALLNGARLVVIDRDTMLEPERLERVIAERGIDTLDVTTALFNAIARVRPATFSGLREVLFGGEAVSPRWVRAVLDAGPPERLLHVYGPTETTTLATWYEVTSVEADDRTVPIGGPIAHTSVHVLDHTRRPVPPGVPGELYIGGPGVALGYLGRPDLTAERFVPDPTTDDPTARLYRTGDVVVCPAPGRMTFVGRTDGQVKIRGFRVELGEIDAALELHPDVAAVATRAVRRGDDTVLVGYVVPEVGRHPTGPELVDHVRPLVPRYMVPTRVELIGELPLNASGKVDRDALPEPRWAEPAVRSGGRGDAAVDERLVRMCELWATNLEQPAVDPDANYFDLGGHSLRAVALVAAAGEEFAVALPISQLIDAPTPRLFLGQIERIGSTGRAGANDSASLEGPAADSRPTDPVVHLVWGSPDLAPLVLVPPDGGVRYVADYRALARHLGSGRSVITFGARGLDGTRSTIDTVAALARHYCEELAAMGPPGPVVVGGHSLGGSVALEMARRLAATGYAVEGVVLLDSGLWEGTLDRWLVLLARPLRRTRDWARRIRGYRPSDLSRDEWALAEVRAAARRAVRAYRPRRYTGEVIYVAAGGIDEGEEVHWRSLPWDRYLPAMRRFEVRGHHSGPDSLLTEPYVAETAAAIRSVLDGG